MFTPPRRAEELRDRVAAFMEEHVYPAEHDYQDYWNGMPTAGACRRSWTS